MIRDRNAELETLSKGFLITFFSEWNCNDYKPDYGLDYKVTIFENRKITEHYFFVQLKATDSININEGYINFDMDVDKHLTFYLQLNVPVLLVLYDAQSQRAYWINIHRYCWEDLDINKPDWRSQKYRRLKIPEENELTNKDIIKEEVIKYTKIILRNITDSFSWSEGYENILNNAEKFKEKIDKDELKLIKSRFHQSLLCFRGADLTGMREQYEKIYNMKRNDEEHLRAILAILMSGDQFLLFEQEKFKTLSDEGLKLAQELGNDFYIIIFSFYNNYTELFGWLFQKLQLMLMKLTIRGQEAHIDKITETIIDAEENRADQKITQLESEIQKIMDHLLEGHHIFEHIQLLLIYLRMDILFSYTLRQAGRDDLVRQKYSQGEDFLIQLLDFIESLNEDELLLNAKLIIGGIFDQFNQDKASEIYNSGLELARKLNHQYYIDKFTLNISELGQQIPPPIDLNTLMNTPLSEVVNMIRKGKQLLINNLGPQILNKINDAFRDLDPLPILKYCKNLIVAYYPEQTLMIYGVYSSGAKRLGCTQKQLSSRSSINLIILMKEFIRNNCLSCSIKEPREENFNPNFIIIEEMLAKIRNIEQKYS